VSDSDSGEAGVRDDRNVPALREVRDQYVNRTAPPASTLVQVSRLPRDNVLLEVEAVAAVRGDSGR
jgi:2-iminobutanoate/2-iminopropanoate deaminase